VVPAAAMLASTVLASTVLATALAATVSSTRTASPVPATRSAGSVATSTPRATAALPVRHLVESVPAALLRDPRRRATSARGPARVTDRLVRPVARRLRRLRGLVGGCCRFRFCRGRRLCRARDELITLL
jgi:hypothetical protein